MKATTQQWLDFAKTDLRSCENNLSDEYVTNIVAFHSQQAVEKAFKALLEEKEIPVPRVHNLIRLHSFTEQFLIEPIDLSVLDALDSVYTSSRYPGDIGLITTGKPTPAEGKELYDSAKKIVEIILHTIVNSY
jgi:HEPN domain-containing protein